MPTLWQDLELRVKVHFWNVKAYWDLGEPERAEIEGVRLLECLRTAKRWKANGNYPRGLGGLLEGHHGDNA
jgi:hypothetical protein